MKPKHIGPIAVNFDDGTCWPAPTEAMGELNRKLRYGQPTYSDLLSAAEILSAYASLIGASAKRRNEVVSALRAVVAAPPPPTDGKEQP
jgi:hypothetical protein